MFTCIVVAIIAALVGVDQLAKWLAAVYLKSGDPVTVIPGVLQLSYTENEGAAFGMMQGGRWFFVALTGILMVALFAFLLSKKMRKFRWFHVSTILIIAGGIGNLIDRIVQGYVVDFFETTFMSFPLFNVADCFVVIGSVLLLIFYGFLYEEDAPMGVENGNAVDDSAER